MNSLTTVGGKVIESEELSSMHDRLKRTGSTSPRGSSGSGSVRRLNSPSSQFDYNFSRRETKSPGNDSPVASAKLTRKNSSAYEADEMKIPAISTRPAALNLPPRSPTFRKKVSTHSITSLSASKAAAHKLNNFQVIDLLEALSQQDSFNKSSYFRGVFTRGIDKVKQCTHVIESIEEALESCFDVSDDMRKVIASKVYADEMMAKMMNPIVAESNDEIDNIRTTRSSNSTKPRPWDNSPRSNQKKSRPWETDGESSNRRPSVQEYMQQIEQRIQNTYDGEEIKQEKTSNKLSVFLANTALEVAVENDKKSRSPFDEALVSPRLIRRKDEKSVKQRDMYTMPFVDEALVSPRFVRRKGVGHHEMAHDVDSNSEVFSGSERLVKELELLEDKKRMTLELEKNRLDLNRQAEEILAFKDAIAEANMAVKTSEESMRELNKATASKDEMIARLESKVKEGEVANAGSQMANQEQVKELGSAVAQLNVLLKQKETESKEISAKLTEAVEKFNESEAKIKELRMTMTKLNEDHIVSVQKLESEKDDLAKELEESKETMTSSLDNTKKQMDGIITEKDKLIYSLSAKIEILEANMIDLKESKLQVDVSTASKEKELNEKIHELATSLIEKDEKMAEFEKEIEELKLSSKREKRKERNERHHAKRRPWDDPDVSLRSSFESKEEHSRRQHRRGGHQRRSHDEERDLRSQKERVQARERYSTPEPYYDERDDGYDYPEREGSLLSPIDDDSYVVHRM